MGDEGGACLGFFFVIIVCMTFGIVTKVQEDFSPAGKLKGEIRALQAQEELIRLKAKKAELQKRLDKRANNVR